ncbi:hypothetical protein ACLK1G_11480 [Pseudomonas sp. NR3]|uniref:hypothetical protein n=1 Tax=Pseudomonas sp. NR3 TaxID=3155978 RepID=UPI003B682162
METYAKPTLEEFPDQDAVTINLSKTKTLTVNIPDAEFHKYSNAMLTLTLTRSVGAFTPLTDGEEGTLRMNVKVALTNADLEAFKGESVELRYEVTYESGGDDKSDPLMLRIKA